jgi:hypothetical protein
MSLTSELAQLLHDIVDRLPWHAESQRTDAHQVIVAHTDGEAADSDPTVTSQDDD